MRALITKLVRITAPTMLLLVVPPSVYGQADGELHRDCATLSEPGHYPDYERTPVYSVERREYDVSKPPVLFLQISISPEGFEGSAIIRLGCKLASDFPKEAAISALIFDDKKAARSLNLGDTDQVNHGQYLWHLKGRYELNRQTNQHFVESLHAGQKDGLLNPVRIKYWLSPAN